MGQVINALRKVNPLFYYAGALLLLVLLPLTLEDYYLSVAVLAGIYIMVGLSLNVIVGYAGMFSVGHAAFYGVGAYTAAILNLNYHIPILLLLPVGGLTAAILGFLLSRPILGLRGDYLTIATIAFNEIFRIVLKNNPFGLTGGPPGLAGISRPEILGLVISQPIHYYYLVLCFVLLTVFIVQRLEHSRLGRAWMYIREDQVAAEAMGIDTTRAKLIAFVIGAAWAGVAGVLYAGRYRVIAPENFVFLESVVMLCIVVLGGLGSIPGVLVGTAAMVVFPEAVREAKNWRDAWMGLAMVVMMIVRPAGLWPSRRAHLEIQQEESVPALTGEGG